MLVNSITRATFGFVLAIALTGVASADPAPIVFAGQGQGVSPAPVQTAALTGGGDNSYGYGESRRGERGAVIDLRRPANRDPRAEAPVFVSAPPEADEEEAPAPAPVIVQAQANTAAPQQRPQWLEEERVGPPYEAEGRWYVPTPEPGYEQTGTASWYGPTFHGQRTSSGEVFDEAALTAAHPTLPLQSLVQVTNLENGREVMVRINDRGPFAGERLIDMSRGAAQVLGFEGNGQARVHVRYLGPAPRRVDAGQGSPAPAANPAPPEGPRAHAANDGPVSLTPVRAEAADDMLAGGLAEVPRQAAPSYAAPAVGGYFVQVGAFSDLANAHRVRDEVSRAGPVVVDVRQTATGGELFRVRVGPWNSREEADSARRSLANLGYGETIVAAR
jgi:rare lipoprotein A